MEFFSAKTVQLKKADFHLHYANNKNRGSNNVTITVVKKDVPREVYTRNYKDYIKQIRVSGWKGKVNIPNSLIEFYGPIINSY